MSSLKRETFGKTDTVYSNQNDHRNRLSIGNGNIEYAITKPPWNIVQLF